MDFIIFSVSKSSIFMSPRTREIKKMKVPQITILFVDDELSNLAMFSKVLEKEGYAVVTMANPLNAIGTFEEDPCRFDLLITDMSMPDNGWGSASGKNAGDTPRSACHCLFGISGSEKREIHDGYRRQGLSSETGSLPAYG